MSMVCGFLVAPPAGSSVAAGPSASHAPRLPVLGQMPLGFEQSVGRLEVRFVAHGAGYEVFITDDQVVTVLLSQSRTANPTQRDLKCSPGKAVDSRARARLWAEKISNLFG